MASHDYHVHSNYSDGEFLWSMAAAAVDAGLDAVGFADHCSVADRPERRRERDRNGFALDITYERRREGIAAVAERHDDLRIYDAVEMDYHPDDEATIEAFLETAGFDYAVGSVHHLDGVNVHIGPYFADKDESERAALVDRYFEKLVALFDAELFEIAAHLDLVERTPALRGFATEAHYERVAAAAAASDTVPEINAGRVLDDYGEYHPSPELLAALQDRGVEFVVGSDAHEPATLRACHERIDDDLAERGVEPTTLSV